MSILFGTADKVSNEKATERLGSFLIEGEEILLSFKTYRDFYALTNKRLLSLDVQGMTGSKKEVRSVSWGKVSGFSIEGAGTFDSDAELKLWVSGMPMIEVKLDRSTPIEDIQRVIAERTL
ncbi:PH domain-containing protein [Parvularcula maris]|uniref:PH domain-containing protein n=1 Tax=Parvularcula maris TaxID=2965077 RepID=A0A9X2L6J3_9PROT|nr:PH domain-containing protein [Parvularcula maris]MCQ8183966.1 PH domain-containing protein [Parvularcula maris]